MELIDEIYLHIKELLLKDDIFLHNTNINMDVTDEKGNTLLHYACSKGDLDVLNFLIRMGVNINSLNKSQEPPILYLFLDYNKDQREVRIEMLEQLLQQGAIVPLVQLENLARENRVSYLYAFYINKHTCYEKMDHSNGKIEKAFDFDDSIQLSFWCETFHQMIDNWESPLIKLHPYRDELVVLHSRGRFSYWKYDSQLTFVRGVCLDHSIGDLSFDPTGKFIIINNSKVYELEPFDKPIWLEQLQQYSWNEYNESILSFSPDGKWVFATYGWDQDDKKVELLAIEIETGREIRRTWLEQGYELWNTDSTMYPRIHQLHLSKDHRGLALFHNHDDPMVAYMNSPIQPLEPHNCVDEYLTEGSLISNIALSQQHTGLVFYFRTPNYWSRRSGDWSGELVALAMQEYPSVERWCQTINAELVGNDTKINKDNYPNGYASKLLAGAKEILCTAPKGVLLYFDQETGELLRKVKVKGDIIFAISRHSTIPNKVRVATNEAVELVDLN